MLGWLDIDPEASRKAMEYLSAFNGKGSIDQLGLGVLRDRMADRLHPATSTLMTNAAYFLLIPRAFRDLEKEAAKKKLSIAQLYAHLEDFESLQAKTLIAEFKRKKLKLEGSGIIGWDKMESGKGWVVQTPSNNYWNPIRKLGLFKHDYTIHNYLKALSNQELKVIKSGDAAADRERQFHTWDEKIPALKTGGIRLDLTPKEAEYLIERFMASKDTKYSYLSEVIRNGKCKRGDDNYAWDHPVADEDQFRELLTQARSLSALIVGANRTYNLLLTKKEGVKDISKTAEEQWEAWFNADKRSPGRTSALKGNFDFFKSVFTDYESSKQVGRALTFLADFQATIKGDLSLKSIQAKDILEKFQLQEKDAKGLPMAKLLKKKKEGSENHSRKIKLGAVAAPDFRWWIAKDIVCDLHLIPKNP